MQVICVVGLVDPSVPMNAPPERVKAERDYVRELYGQGPIRQAWLKADAGGAVLMLEVPSAAEAVRLLSELPLIKDGLLRIEATYPLAPFRGFATVS